MPEQIKEYKAKCEEQWRDGAKQ